MITVGDLDPHTELDELVSEIPQSVVNGWPIASDAGDGIGADHGTDLGPVCWEVPRTTKNSHQWCETPLRVRNFQYRRGALTNLRIPAPSGLN